MVKIRPNAISLGICPLGLLNTPNIVSFMDKSIFFPILQNIMTIAIAAPNKNVDIIPAMDKGNSRTSGIKIIIPIKLSPRT